MALILGGLVVKQVQPPARNGSRIAYFIGQEIYAEIFNSRKMETSPIEDPIISALTDVGDTIRRWTMKLNSNSRINERAEKSDFLERHLHELQPPRNAVQPDDNAVHQQQELSVKRAPAMLESLECLANTFNMLCQFKKGVDMTECALSLRAGTFDKARIETLTIIGYVAGCLGRTHPFTLRATAIFAATCNSISENRDAVELTQTLLGLFERLSHLLPLQSLKMIARSFASDEDNGHCRYEAELREKMLLLSKQHSELRYPDIMIAISELATIFECINLYFRAAEPKGPSLKTRRATTVSPIVSHLIDVIPIASDHDVSNGVGGVSAALERDRQMLLAHRGSVSTMSRRRITPHHMRLLKTYLTELLLRTFGNHQEMVRLPSGRPQQRQMIESDLEGTSINITEQRAVNQTQGDFFEAGQYQLLDYRGRENAVSTCKDSKIEPLIDFNTLWARFVQRKIMKAIPTCMTQCGQAEDLMSRGLANEGSGRNDGNRPTSCDNINETEAKGLAQTCTSVVSVPKYAADLQGLTDRQISPRTLSNAVSHGNVDAVRDVIEGNFDAVAKEEYEWIQELHSLGYGSYDIAELLVDDFNNTPWIFFDPAEPPEIFFLPHVHRPNCCHQGGEEAKFAPRLKMTDYENPESMKRLIAEQCGLAGVLPKSRKLEEWTGHVTFAGDADSTAWITYFVTGSCYQLSARIHEALERFCGIASYLKKEQLCCTSFTVLHYAFRHELPAIELSHIDFDLAFNLLIQFQPLRGYWRSPGIPPKFLHEVLETADQIVKIVCDKTTFDREGEVSYEMCLDTVSLAVQILYLGLYLYSQSHTGAVHPFFLVNPVRRIGLFGAQPAPSDSGTAHLHVSLSPLTCMAEVQKI